MPLQTQVDHSFQLVPVETRGDFLQTLGSSACRVRLIPVFLQLQNDSPPYICQRKPELSPLPIVRSHHVHVLMWYLCNTVRTCIRLNDSLPPPSFALISDPACQYEVPSPAAEPAAAPHGEQGARGGKGIRKNTSGVKYGAEELEWEGPDVELDLPTGQQAQLSQ